MSKGSFVAFTEVRGKTRTITSVWRVVSTQGDKLLGGVKWFPAWRRYCFWPLTDMIFDAACMREIADFCSDQTYIQKQDQAQRRAER